MNKSKVYAKMIKWTDKYVEHYEFIVLWSDHTWDEFQFQWNNHKIKEYKKHFCLGQLTSRKIAKDEAIKFIEYKIKEIEEES